MKNGTSITAYALTKDQLELKYFHYYASHIGAEIWIALFGVTAIVGLFMSMRYKATYMYILPFCAAIEAAGYGTRLQSAENPELTPFIVSTLFILLAPIFLALINYTTVGKLIESTGRRIGCINPSSISYWFFASDFAGLIIQGIGGSVLASATTQATFDLGANIILAGLSIQIFFFSVFTFMMFQSAYSSTFNLYARDDLKTAFNVLFSTTILIYVRNLFRLIEYASGHTSYITTHEWCFFTFESAPMFLVCLAYCIWPFGATLPDEFLKTYSSSKVQVISIQTSETEADEMDKRPIEAQV
mmetsp:Transcript_12906/g.17702  ORF Transcript_12906/g.17702 Transcript_12906/m.17702 type:complete len:302 (+) Transcript_12906:31-936(+)